MKIRHGFVSNSSSSSYLININSFKSTLDLGQYMLEQYIAELDYDYDDDVSQAEKIWLAQKRKCLYNICELKKSIVNVADQNIPIAFRSTNYDTFIRKIRIQDEDYYYVTTCNNVMWNLPSINTSMDEYEMDQKFIKGNKFIELSTMKEFEYDIHSYGIPEELTEISENEIEKTLDFRKELEELLNRHNMENGSNTPDFILAQYLEDCLFTFDRANIAREKWYGRQPRFATEIDSHKEPK